MAVVAGLVAALAAVWRWFCWGSVAWCSLGFVAALYQEGLVGWRKIERWPAIAAFFGGMIVVTYCQQFFVLAWMAVVGWRTGGVFAYFILRTFWAWFGPLVWGPFRFEGHANLPPDGEACIYMANHQCSVDFVTIFAFPNKPRVVGVAKYAMIFLPGFGAMIGLVGGIFVSRGKKGVLAMMVEKGIKTLHQEGHSIGIFPQGTRNVPEHGKPYKPFKIGGFKLAVEAQVRIVPYTIVYPSNFMEAVHDLREGLRIIIHPPVDPGKDPAALLSTVEKIIMAPVLEQLDKEQAELKKKSD